MNERQIQEQINQKDRPLRVELEGTIRLNVRKEATIYIGKQFVKGTIVIERPRVTIDGTNALLEVNVESCSQTDCSLFCVMPSAYDVRLLNLTIDVTFPACPDLPHMFSVIYNAAFGLQMENCRIRVRSQAQTDFAIVYNNGNLDTHMGTRADNLVVSNCYLEAVCNPDSPSKSYMIYGLYNNLANSIVMHDTHIFVSCKGNGEKQRAVGLYTSGRFGRFVGNNIKANGTHNVGKEREQSYVTGVINEGLHNIFTANNIVAEWAGKAVAFENDGAYAEISSNKLLATHTINGITLFSKGDSSIVQANVIVSTSRNAKLIILGCNYSIIGKNILDIFMARTECRSGCGIQMLPLAEGNIISENMIHNLFDCGIFVKKEKNVLLQNQFLNCEKNHSFDSSIEEKLDERRIKSLYE